MVIQDIPTLLQQQLIIQTKNIYLFKNISAYIILITEHNNSFFLHYNFQSFKSLIQVFLKR